MSGMVYGEYSFFETLVNPNDLSTICAFQFTKRKQIKVCWVEPQVEADRMSNPARGVITTEVRNTIQRVEIMTIAEARALMAQMEADGWVSGRYNSQGMNYGLRSIPTTPGLSMAQMALLNDHPSTHLNIRAVMPI